MTDHAPATHADTGHGESDSLRVDELDSSGAAPRMVMPGREMRTPR